MKLKIDWKALAVQIWNALKPVIIGAVGGGIVSFSASGCYSLTPSDKTQTMGVYAFGIPGIAVISQTTQAADNKGEDTNVPVQGSTFACREAIRSRTSGALLLVCLIGHVST